ncbi:LrgB family protein [Paraburkholderia caribensis]|uniref:LrgB family protein n=1 Tax=Paraburkholderia caribensis TaxID=75105 RepID=UPI001F34BAE3|nr:LrgB family protein [Paraburkholderia caribensis]
MATLVAYEFGVFVQRKANGNPFANPVLVAVVSLVTFLLCLHIPYREYYNGAQYVNFLLGPATVALAVPMYRNIHHIRKTARALVPAIVMGSIFSAGSAAALAKILGAKPIVTTSLIAHSATTPVAMSISEGIGGSASLTATFTLLTGIVGVLLVGITMEILRIRDVRAHGLAAGTAGHGLTTARMLALNETAGAFGGLAIGLNGVLTALIAPIVSSLILRW